MSVREKNTLWFYMFIVYVPLSFSYPIISFALRDNNTMLIMDSTNTYHIVEASDEEQRKRFYKEIGQDAVNAFLMRNPKGLDFPVKFDDIYTGRARKLAEKYIESELQKFKEYDIHQKCEIINITVLPAQKTKAFIKVSGQLIRTYIDEREKMSYSMKFKAFLTLEANMNLKTNAKFPYQVTEMKYKQQVEKDKEASR